MANPTYKDAAGTTRSIAGSGNAGTDGDPDVLKRAVASIPAGAMVDVGNSTSTGAVVTDAVGTVIGFLRGLVKILAERFPAVLGQGTKAQSLSVTLASNQDAVAIAAGAASIGGVKDNGVFYTPTQTLGSSADAAAAALDITTAPVNSANAVMIDDLTFSAAVDMVVTVKEFGGANLMLFYYKTAQGVVRFRPRNWLRASVNKKIQVSASIAGQVYTWASWHEQ